MQVFKQKLMSILEREGYAEKRSSKLSLDDYLKLLYAFNREGVHFRWRKVKGEGIIGEWTGIDMSKGII